MWLEEGNESVESMPVHTYLFNIGSLSTNDELHSLLGNSHLYLDVIFSNKCQSLFYVDHDRSELNTQKLNCPSPESGYKRHKSKRQNVDLNHMQYIEPE